MYYDFVFCLPQYCTYIEEKSVFLAYKVKYHFAVSFLASWCAQCHEARCHHGWSQPRLCTGGSRSQPSGSGCLESTEALSSAVSGSSVWCSHLDWPQGDFWCTSRNKVRDCCMPYLQGGQTTKARNKIRCGGLCCYFSSGINPSWKDYSSEIWVTCRNTVTTLPSYLLSSPVFQSGFRRSGWFYLRDGVVKNSKRYRIMIKL